MKTAVMAAGGIGGYFGALLAKNGHEVVFVARGDHLKAILNQGLSVKSIDDEFRVKPAIATDDPAQIGPVDLILFAVKTYDTDESAFAIRPMVGQETVVVTFQNGIESAQQIEAVLGQGRVVSAPTQIESFIAGPGRIEQRSNFRVVTFAEADVIALKPVKVLVDVFRTSNFQVNLVSDIKRAVWLKFLRLAPVAGFATLARESPYELFKSEEARGVLEAAMREIMALGRAESVMLADRDLQDAMQWALELRQGIKPSMQKDLERGNRLEIDSLNGAVVRLGKKHGLATPVNQTVLVGLKPEDERNKRAKEDKA